jgi:DNA-binding Lrp family transcriptional regulator
MSSKPINSDTLKVLWGLQEKPLGTVQTLSKKTGFRPGKVQYLLNRLKSDRGLVVRPFINFLATGAHYIAVYANFSAPSSKARAALVTSLTKESIVSSCSELIGDYELAFTVSCGHLKEIRDLFERVTTSTRVEFSEYILSPRMSFSFFKRKFLTRNTVIESSLDAEYPDKPANLDSLDLKILKAVADARFDSVRDIARLVNIPISTVDRRIRNLREQRVILGDFIDLAPQHLGVHPYRLLIRTKGLSPADKRDIYEFSRQHRRVIFIINTLGIFDLEIGLELSDPGSIMEVISDYNERFGAHIHTLRSLMESKPIKWSTYPGEGFKQSSS